MDPDEVSLKEKIERVATENRLNSNRFLLVVIGLVVFLLGFVAGYVVISGSRQVIVTQQIPTETTYKYKLLDEVWKQLDANYINKDISEKDMIYGSAKGMIKSLNDRFSVFLTPQEVLDSNKSNAGVFEGIGTTLRFDGDYTVIETPITGFPAWRAGLMPRDVILEVDREDMTSKSATYVANKILGNAGTIVHIKVFRESEGQAYEFDIARERIDIDNVEVKKLDDDIYVITVHKFTEESVSEFKKNWDDAVSAINNPKSVILDLRNNPGGYVDASTHVLEEFLKRGDKLLSEVDRNGKTDAIYSTRDGKFTNTPLVVLVNAGSASASEIVAGSLQDYSRAKLVGEKTLGKGVEQRVINLSDGSSMHLVFRKWLTPKGNNINFDSPISPDIPVGYGISDFKANKDPQTDKVLELLKTNNN